MHSSKISLGVEGGPQCEWDIDKLEHTRGTKDGHYLGHTQIMKFKILRYQMLLRGIQGVADVLFRFNQNLPPYSGNHFLALKTRFSLFFVFQEGFHLHS